MGGGSWKTDTHTARAAAKAASGTATFHHTAAIHSGAVAVGVHEDLDPKKVCGPGSPNEGKNIREGFDSDEHPESVQIGVLFDVTGSMHTIPQTLQAKLPELHGLILRKGYLDHPQILFGAIGDAHWDRVPLQVGQFESDNRMDEQLESIYLEGGGGGGGQESYELAAYFMARHTQMDCWDKRQKKGYLFLMGDETPYSAIRHDQVKALIGDDGLEGDIPTEKIFEELQERFEVFFLFVEEGSYTKEAHLPPWQALLGERALVLENADAVCETIALTIGLLEGAVTYDDGMADLEEVSTDLSAVKAAGKALAAVGAGTVAVAESSGGDLDLGDDASGADRV